ncbi:hypothetical protein PoB_005020600 [Plakobranchus ocellatus]|uniref:MADF domain-containing protein n=1 Tax=Plakobranchus ocellatus TaxID=259542 RepID=A0AAV4BX72_9GAST|nr:hypothetical protein PoB_005020600 [Plakobranchus ocellatus]
MDCEKLTSAVFERPIIWDKRNRLHGNRNAVEKKWSEISKEMNCEATWTKTRHCRVTKARPRPTCARHRHTCLLLPSPADLLCRAQRLSSVTRGRPLPFDRIPASPTLVKRSLTCLHPHPLLLSRTLTKRNQPWISFLSPVSCLLPPPYSLFSPGLHLLPPPLLVAFHLANLGDDFLPSLSPFLPQPSPPSTLSNQSQMARQGPVEGQQPLAAVLLIFTINCISLLRLPDRAVKTVLRDETGLDLAALGEIRRNFRGRHVTVGVTSASPRTRDRLARMKGGSLTMRINNMCELKHSFFGGKNDRTPPTRLPAPSIRRAHGPPIQPMRPEMPPPTQANRAERTRTKANETGPRSYAAAVRTRRVETRTMVVQTDAPVPDLAPALDSLVKEIRDLKCRVLELTCALPAVSALRSADALAGSRENAPL